MEIVCVQSCKKVPIVAIHCNGVISNNKSIANLCKLMHIYKQIAIKNSEMRQTYCFTSFATMHNVSPCTDSVVFVDYVLLFILY